MLFGCFALRHVFMKRKCTVSNVLGHFDLENQKEIQIWREVGIAITKLVQKSQLLLNHNKRDSNQHILYLMFIDDFNLTKCNVTGFHNGYTVKHLSCI